MLQFIFNLGFAFATMYMVREISTLYRVTRSIREELQSLRNEVRNVP